MTTSRYLSYPLIAIWLVLGLLAVVPSLAPVAAAWRDYLWFGAGIVAYAALARIPVFGKNVGWMQVFSHELAHTAVGLMFFQRIHSFNADSRKGRVSYSGSKFGDIFISLAPYCLPLITYVLLLFRLLGAPDSLYIFDMLIGFTTAFYACCFYSQTGTFQSDITEQGTVRAFMFIIAAWIFNATVIVLSIRGGIWNALKTIAASYCDNIVSAWAWIAGLF